MMTIHPVHPADLSSYYDGELPVVERRRVEDHVAGCTECREILRSYASMGRALRESTPEPIPLAVDRRVRSMLRESRSRTVPRRPGLQSLFSPRPVFAGAAFAALLLVVAILGLPFGGSSGPRVASAYLYDEAGTPTIEVRFTGPVNRETVRRSVRIDPPVEVNVSWRGDSLVVQPSQPLQKVSYTLSLKADTPSGSGGTVPVAFDLPPANIAPVAATTPVALPTKALPVAAASATPAKQAAPSPSASPSPTASPTVTATATPASYQVVRGFGLLLRSQPNTAAALGSPREAEHSVDVVTQRFQNGSMLWRGDRKEIIVLLDNGRWRSFADSFDGVEPVPSRSGEPARGFGKLWREQTDLRVALGSATAAEIPVTGVVIQEFEKGLLIWTPDRYISVLFTGGSWDRYPDTYQDPGTTVVPTATATAATVTSTPTPATTRVPGTVSPTSTSTAEPGPTPDVTPTLETTPTVTATPTITPTPGKASGGTVTPTPSVTPSPVVSTPSATRTPTPAPATGTPVPVATSTPGPRSTQVVAECKAAPNTAFGALATAVPSIGTRMGCAQAPEASIQVVRQSFEHGQMIWRSDTSEIIVLPRDGGWSAYADSWLEGEALADVGTPPGGLLAPARGFGKLWRMRPDVRATLGWATGTEQQLSGIAQEFAGGQMVWTSNRSITVLYTGGSWQSLPDPST